MEPFLSYLQVALCLCFKTSPHAKSFIWKWVWLTCAWEKNYLSRTHFHISWLTVHVAWRLKLKQRQKATRKWLISLIMQQTPLTFTVQDLSQSSEEKQSCISSTNGCDCLWHKVIVCFLFAVNHTLWCLTGVWSLGTVTHWVTLFFTFCWPWFWPFRLTFIFSFQIILPFGSVWFICRLQISKPQSTFVKKLSGTMSQKDLEQIAIQLKGLTLNMF